MRLSKYMLSIKFPAGEYEPRSDGASYWNSRIVTTTELLHPRFEDVPLRFNRNHFEAELGFPPSPNPDPWPPVPQPPEPRLPPERKDPTLPDPDPEPDFPGLPEPARAHSPHSLAHFKWKYRFSIFACSSIGASMRKQDSTKPSRVSLRRR